MPVYELKKGRRFWEITLTHEYLTTNWGKIGTRGESETQLFFKSEKAQLEWDRLIAEKTKEGYTLMDGGDLAGEYTDTSGRLKRNPKLEAAIAKDPDNVEGYLVYGDWLQGQGDPRGELIALQCAAHQASGKEAMKLKRQAAALLREDEQYFLGRLAGKEDTDVKLEWRFGFIRSARLSRGDSDTAFDISHGVRVLMKLPAACFLREFTLGRVYGAADYDRSVSALAETPCSTLERLFIGDFEFSDYKGGDLYDVSPLKVFPRLRVLKLRLHGYGLDAVHLPGLRELSIESERLTSGLMRSIVKAKWPKLERLEVGVGTRDYGQGGCQETDLEPLLAGQRVPKLKHLGLSNAMFTYKLCAMLPGAKVLPQLESLDLSGGTISDTDAAVLAEHAAAFKHLKHLDVSKNMLSAKGQKKLAKLCASVATGNQREYYADTDDENNRYMPADE